MDWGHHQERTSTAGTRLEKATVKQHCCHDVELLNVAPMFAVTVHSTWTDSFTHHPKYLCNDRKRKKELHYQIKLLRQD